MANQQIPLNSEARADDPVWDDMRDDGTMEIALDIAYKRLAIVNIVLIGTRAAHDREWVLVDAGVFGTKSLIETAARGRFGQDSRPRAIVLTHGHFDHVGVLEE